MRARNLKPSLFKNELLATSDPLYTWVFQGLWCIADREGRLEDRPRRIHLEVNAGRAYEGTEQALLWLADNGFITRYSIGEGKYIQVLNFKKHQNPHVREPASTIPAQGQHCAGPVPEPGEHESGPALSSFPLPESPSPHPVPAPAAPVCPGLDLKAWERWVVYRAEIRKPLRPTSFAAAQKALAAFGADQASVVEQSIANGWQGLFEPKKKPKTNGGWI